MRYYVLLGLITFGAYVAANVALATVLAVLWPRCRPVLASASARARAKAIAMLRLAPAALAAVWTVLVANTFLRFEPRGTTESAGVLLTLAAACGAGLAAMALIRLAIAVRGNLRCASLLRECGREWKRVGRLPVWIVDTSYPVAAIAGVFRSRLLISSRIASACPHAEMEAIIQHEMAHLRRRDNLMRAAMRCLPDALALTPTAVEMHDAWSSAVEQAADDEAAGMDAQSRTDLASALLRVAGMAQEAPPPWMPEMVAFYEGSNLEDRVRHLLAPRAAGRSLPVGLAAAAALTLAAGAFLLTDEAARRLHAVMELAVGVLP